MQGAGREAIVTLWRGSRNAADATKSARPQDEVRQIILTRRRLLTVTMLKSPKVNATNLIIYIFHYHLAVFMKYPGWAHQRSIFPIRWIISSSRSSGADRAILNQPSPAVPKPLPGVMTTPASPSSLAAHWAELNPAGFLAQT